MASMCEVFIGPTPLRSFFPLTPFRQALLVRSGEACAPTPAPKWELRGRSCTDRDAGKLRGANTATRYWDNKCPSFRARILRAGESEPPCPRESGRPARLLRRRRKKLFR